MINDLLVFPRLASEFVDVDDRGCSSVTLDVVNDARTTTERGEHIGDRLVSIDKSIFMLSTLTEKMNAGHSQEDSRTHIVRKLFLRLMGKCFDCN